jgi:pimeloyl-ACP methyl ester carboxylesterase
VPAIAVYGADDALGPPTTEVTAAERQVLPMLIEKRVVPGAGHFVPHEKPEPTAAALLDLLRAAS